MSRFLLKTTIILFAIILSSTVQAKSDSYETLLKDLENYHSKIIKRMHNLDKKKRKRKNGADDQELREELVKLLRIERPDREPDNNDDEFQAPLPPGEIPQDHPPKKRVRLNLKTPEDLIRSLKKYNPGFQGKCKIKVEHGKIISVELENKNIVNILPISNLKHLESLDLSNNPVTDITPLKKLKKLNWLSLNNTFVSDLSPLKNLKLSGLELAMTPITDLSPLKKMKLEELSLQSCVFLDNIDAIGKIKTLRELILPPHFKKLHINFIKQLKRLEYLDIKWRHEDEKLSTNEFLEKFGQYIK